MLISSGHGSVPGPEGLGFLVEELPSGKLMILESWLPGSCMRIGTVPM